MTMHIGTSGGAKAVSRLVVGTAGGAKDVLAGYVGTAEGAKVFYASTFPVTAVKTIDWHLTEYEGSPNWQSEYAATPAGGTGPYDYQWFPSGTVQILGQLDNWVILANLDELPEPGSVYCVVTDSFGAQGISNSVAY